MIIFTRTVHDAQRLSIVLRRLGFPAIPLHGQMSQSMRLASLNKFKSGGRSILVATDVASRGLDIPLVDLVIVSFRFQEFRRKLMVELRYANQL
jgi:ATP-dependent RNA helicase DDX47/RRP3